MSTEKPASADALATAELKSTAKWLVGAGATIISVVIAGLQLAQLGQLGEAPLWVVAVALFATLCALAVVCRVLVLAASVLGTTLPTIAELDKEDREDHGGYPKRLEQPSAPLYQELVVLRRTELLGAGRDSIASLVDDTNSVSNALANLARISIRGRTYDPTTAEDLSALRVLDADLQRRTRNVLEAAERFQTASHYLRLTSQLPVLGGVFLAGIVVLEFLMISYSGQTSRTPRVTAPVEVEIVVPSRQAAVRAGLEPACGDRVLTGAAVGGTFPAPTVVTRAQGDCQAHRLTDTGDLIVVPVPSQ